jgi:hypothetical protein
MLKVTTGRENLFVLKDNQTGSEGYVRPFGHYDPPLLVLMNI